MDGAFGGFQPRQSLQSFNTISVILRNEESVSSVADASCLSMTIYSRCCLLKVFSLLSGLLKTDGNSWV